jgi:acyl-CoA synthetase (NDP forming)
VAIFMETVRQPEVFRRAARRAAGAGKAVVVLKAGSSALSARTAAAHTGALVGDDRVIGSVFADLGVIRVDSIEDMLITAGAAAALGRLDRPGIGIVSISGGACDIVADRAEDLGAALPELAAPTRDALAAIMPAYGTVQNPLDVTGAAVIDRRDGRHQRPAVDRPGPAVPRAAVRRRDRRGHACGLLPDRLHQPGHAAGH